MAMLSTNLPCPSPLGRPRPGDLSRMQSTHARSSAATTRLSCEFQPSRRAQAAWERKHTLQEAQCKPMHTLTHRPSHRPPLPLKDRVAPHLMMLSSVQCSPRIARHTRRFQLTIAGYGLAAVTKRWASSFRLVASNASLKANCPRRGGEPVEEAWGEWPAAWRLCHASDVMVAKRRTPVKVRTENFCTLSHI